MGRVVDVYLLYLAVPQFALVDVGSKSYQIVRGELLAYVAGGYAKVYVEVSYGHDASLDVEIIILLVRHDVQYGLFGRDVDGQVAGCRTIARCSAYVWVLGQYLLYLVQVYVAQFLPLGIYLVL